MATASTRPCTSCHTPCAPEDFHRGEAYRCKRCARARAAAWRARTRTASSDAPVRRDGTRRAYIPTRALRNAIATRGPVTAGGLARQAGIDRTTASGILAERRPLVSLRVADRICTALGLDLDQLPAVRRCDITA